jgi:Sulfatase
MTSRAIAYVREQKAIAPDKPFFAYVSYGACHAPFHVPESYIAKYRGKFDQGWDAQRVATFARQKELGVIPQDCQLTERPKEIAAWDSLSNDQKRIGYSFDDAKATERHTTQHFEMFCNRGIYHEGWVACTKDSTPWMFLAKLPKFDDDVWELYAPGDWSQANDVAAQNPTKLRELQQIFLIEGAKHNVFPLDDRQIERLNSDLAGRPDLTAGRATMTLYPGMSQINENTVLNVKNKSHALTARFTVPDGKATGAIIAQGGRFGGWCLYLKEGVPAHCYNFLGFIHTYARGSQPLGAGEHTLRYEFTYDGGGVGKGGLGVLSVDGDKVGQARTDRTVPFLFSADDLMDIGKDTGAPVTEDYETPQGRFTGNIAWVRIDIGKDAFEDAVGMDEALTGRS